MMRIAQVGRTALLLGWFLGRPALARVGSSDDMKVDGTFLHDLDMHDELLQGAEMINLFSTRRRTRAGRSGMAEEEIDTISKVEEESTLIGGNPAPEIDNATADCHLDDFPQWQAEEGYWIGEYSYYGPDGTPFNSSTWNYRYDSYRGFVTGHTSGPSYRQRNVFLYPPQFEAECEIRSDVIGNGTCGVNGNSKLFFADQSVNPGAVCDGSIGGDYDGIFDTHTHLIGKDDAVLYQVYFKDGIPGVGGTLFQSQLTTLTVDAATGQQRRTRSAQSFAPTGVPRSLSFYRERRVSEDEFFDKLQETLLEYNLLETDTCAWRDDNTGQVTATDGEPGLRRCIEHLNESFELD